MSYVPKVRHDVFICHAHNDDDPRGNGWVSQFRRDLEANLVQRLGAVDVFMDDRLNPDERYRDQLRDDVEHSALFVPVMSPSLLLSDFCTDELRWFTESLHPSSGNENASLVFKVVLLPDLAGMYRYWCRGVTDVEFYTDSTGVKRNLKRSLQRSEAQYWSQVQYLGATIAERLDSLKARFDPVFVVYVSQGSLSSEVKKLEASLRGDGNRILPGIYIPDIGQARDLLSQQISESRYCIFLLGPQYNQQIEELLAIAKENKKRTIFWIGDRERSQMGDDQRKFIRRIENEGLEVYKGNLASQMYDRIRTYSVRPGPIQTLAPGTSASSIQLYVISERKGSNKEEAARIAQQIHKENLLQPEPLQLLPFQAMARLNGTPSSLRKKHSELLRTCDAVLICWEQGDKGWLRDTWREITDRKDDGRAGYKSAAIFAAIPVDEDRSRVIKSLHVEEEVIGKPGCFNTGPSTASGSENEGVGKTTQDREFDPGRLRRFLSPLS